MQCSIIQCFVRTKVSPVQQLLDLGLLLVLHQEVQAPHPGPHLRQRLDNLKPGVGSEDHGDMLQSQLLGGKYFPKTNLDIWLITLIIDRIGGRVQEPLGVEV